MTNIGGATKYPIARCRYCREMVYYDAARHAYLTMLTKLACKIGKDSIHEIHVDIAQVDIDGRYPRA